jgi:hypothetical protein
MDSAREQKISKTEKYLKKPQKPHRQLRALLAAIF